MGKCDYKRSRHSRIKEISVQVEKNYRTPVLQAFEKSIIKRSQSLKFDLFYYYL